MTAKQKTIAILKIEEGFDKIGGNREEGFITISEYAPVSVAYLKELYHSCDRFNLFCDFKKEAIENIKYR